jgi:hypothetical protein
MKKVYSVGYIISLTQVSFYAVDCLQISTKISLAPATVIIINKLF